MHLVTLRGTFHIVGGAEAIALKQRPRVNPLGDSQNRPFPMTSNTEEIKIHHLRLDFPTGSAILRSIKLSSRTVMAREVEGNRKCSHVMQARRSLGSLQMRKIHINPDDGFLSKITMHKYENVDVAVEKGSPPGSQPNRISTPSAMRLQGPSYRDRHSVQV